MTPLLGRFLFYHGDDPSVMRHMPSLLEDLYPKMIGISDIDRCTNHDYPVPSLPFMSFIKPESDFPCILDTCYHYGGLIGTAAIAQFPDPPSVQDMVTVAAPGFVLPPLFTEVLD